MRIFCERCSAVYELDERVLPPGGSPVQCTRCQHVFQAFPPQAPGRTLPMIPAAEGASPPAAGLGGAPPVAPGAPSGRAGSTSTFWPAAPSAAPAPAVPSAAPARPPPAAPSAAARPPPARPAPRRPGDGTGAPSARGPWRWLGPLLVVLAGAGTAVWWLRPSRIDPAATARWQEGLRVLARDDDRSLEEAARLLGSAAELDPRLFQARADRALALSLIAADERERASDAEAVLRAREAERSRPGADGAGAPSRPAEPGEKPAQDDLAAIRDRVARITAEASAGLEAQGPSRAGDPSVARARAVHYAVAGDREQAARVVSEARAAGLSDPWLDLAEAAGDLGTTESARRQAAARLAALAAAHPEMLRARMLLARAEAALGDAGAALAALDGVLAANPGHDLARRMKERLLVPPPAEPKPEAPAPPPGR